MFYNKEGVFRLKPVYNKDVNGYWMCDEGRDTYKFVNKSARLLDARVMNKGAGEWLLPEVAAKKVGETLKGSGRTTALVLTGQYSVEEYEAIVSYFKNEVGTDRIFHWKNNPENFESFDGLLLRGDKNPNTKGLIETLSKNGMTAQWKDLVDGLQTGAIKTVVVAGPENQAAFPDLKAKIIELSRASKLVWMQAGKNDQLEALDGDVTLIPLKTYVEKDGTYVNHAGIRQTVHAGLTVVPNSLSLIEAVHLFRGEVVQPEAEGPILGKGRVHNEYTLVRGTL
jgi:NADH-quinone oxidoreductase subunit G